MDEINSLLETKIIELSHIQEKLKNNLTKKNHIIKELEQEKILLCGSSDELEKKNKNLHILNDNLLKIFNYQSTTSKESEQEKLLLSEITHNQTKENKYLKKKYFQF